MDITRDDILHGLFTTACEGGIGYWAYVEKYHYGDPEKTWPEPGAYDLESFKAVIGDAEGEGFGGEEHIDELVIDRAVIEKGLALYVDFGWVGYKGSFADDVRFEKWEECDYDADIADCVVQFGLFGEVRFS